MKKKLVFIMITLAILLGLTAVPAAAGEPPFEVGDIMYKVTSDTDHTVEVIDYSSTAGNVVIPETVEHNSVRYAVTSIGTSAFRDNSSVLTVTIPNGVTSIGDYAFSS